eukprot:4521938-Pyramimonas_sp.AAC.2
MIERTIHPASESRDKALIIYREGDTSQGRATSRCYYDGSVTSRGEEGILPMWEPITDGSVTSPSPTDPNVLKRISMETNCYPFKRARWYRSS